MNINLDLESDTEQKIKSQTDEMFGYVGKMMTLKKKDFGDFLALNKLNPKWPKGTQDKVDIYDIQHEF